MLRQNFQETAGTGQNVAPAAEATVHPVGASANRQASTHKQAVIPVQVCSGHTYPGSPSMGHPDP